MPYSTVHDHILDPLTPFINLTTIAAASQSISRKLGFIERKLNKISVFNSALFIFNNILLNIQVCMHVGQRLKKVQKKILLGIIKSRIFR